MGCITHNGVVYYDSSRLRWSDLFFASPLDYRLMGMVEDDTLRAKLRWETRVFWLKYNFVLLLTIGTIMWYLMKIGIVEDARQTLVVILSSQEWEETKRSIDNLMKFLHARLNF